MIHNKIKERFGNIKLSISEFVDFIICTEELSGFVNIVKVKFYNQAYWTRKP